MDVDVKALPVDKCVLRIQVNIMSVQSALMINPIGVSAQVAVLEMQRMLVERYA